MGSWPSSLRTASVCPPYLAFTIVSLNLEQAKEQVLLTKATGEQHSSNKLRRKIDRERKAAAV